MHCHRPYRPSTDRLVPRNRLLFHVEASSCTMTISAVMKPKVSKRLSSISMALNWNVGTPYRKRRPLTDSNGSESHATALVFAGSPLSRISHGCTTRIAFHQPLAHCTISAIWRGRRYNVRRLKRHVSRGAAGHAVLSRRHGSDFPDRCRRGKQNRSKRARVCVHRFGRDIRILAGFAKRHLFPRCDFL